MVKETELDRRRYERMETKRPVTLLVEAQSQRVAQPTVAIDLSQGGARVQVPASVHLIRGQVVEFIPKEQNGKAVPSRVVWVGAAGSGLQGLAGIDFLHPIRLDA